MSDFKIKVAIHSALAKRYPANVMRYYEILKHNNIEAVLVDASDDDYWQQVKSSSHYIHHYCHRTSEMQVADAILPAIDIAHGTPRFPNQQTAWLYDDKIRQSYLLSEMGFPFAKSWIFYDLDSALAWIETADFPLVYKLKAGAGSGNVLLLRTKKQAAHLAKRMFESQGVDSSRLPDRSSLYFLRNIFGIYKFRQIIALLRKKIHYQDVNPYWQRQRDYVLFQEFLPDNDFDTRITVIGNRAFAFRRHNRENDFRASGSGKMDYDQAAIDPRCIDIALNISREMGFQSMAYDFMFDRDNNPKLGEVSFTYIDSYVQQCPGYYLGSSSQWVEASSWPQFWILSDLLGVELVEPDLRQVSDYVRLQGGVS